eukprot:6090135-Alexandrium_andersonii.AAC.1
MGSPRTDVSPKGLMGTSASPSPKSQGRTVTAEPLSTMMLLGMEGLGEEVAPTISMPIIQSWLPASD